MVSPRPFPVSCACTAAAKTKGRITAPNARKMCAFMANYPTTLASCLHGAGPHGRCEKARGAVPIIMPFGHTPADASLSAAHIGPAEPLRARPLGRARVHPGLRLLCLRGAGRARSNRLAGGTRSNADLPESFGAHRLLGAHRPANADRAGGLASLHLHLRNARSQEPARGSVVGATAGFPAVGTDSELLHLHSLFPA